MIAVVQVKTGLGSADQIRDLKGVMEREKAAIGIFVTLVPPTRAMREKAASAGLYVPDHFSDQQFSRLQILTIQDLFDGAKVAYPTQALAVTSRQAERRRKRSGASQERLN